MARDSSSYTLIVVAVTLGMLAVPLPAMATHNSVGVNAVVLQPDEMDADGDGLPDPDIQEDGRFDYAYHGETLKTPRPQPDDQRGERYTDCTTAEEAGDNYDPSANPSHCYIGFFDAQLEYTIHHVPISFGGDLLYAANPAEGDQDCPGPSEDPAAYAQNLEGLIFISECSGGDHKQKEALLGDIAIDSDLVEAAFQSDQNAPGADGVVGSPTGSGMYSLPVIAREYVYIFGEPHDSNENPSGADAGAGAFGPNPLEGGNPLGDLTGACGERTAACQLLTPEDIRAYDRYTVPANEEDEPRVCQYSPNYVSSSPSAGPCGFFGETMVDFFAGNYGGFGIDGAPDTMVTTLPGWYGFAIIGTPNVALADGTAADYLDDEQEIRTSAELYYAVNPRVPLDGEKLKCLRPNFLATGDGAGDISAEQDPGVYGTYKADAVDVDIYSHPALGPVETVRDATHDQVNGIWDTAVAVVNDGTGAAGDALDDVPDIPDIPDPVLEALDRADYQEANNEELDDRLNNTDADFDKTNPAGVRCDASFTLRTVESEQTIYGGTQHNANVLRNTVSLKDPTLMEEGQPARESETHEGTWQPDAYTFSGGTVAKYDSNRNDQFDDCAPSDGQPHPEDDQCVWQPYWDAYNGACTTSGEDLCGDKLEETGYDVSGTDSSEASGVGMYFTLHLTGPFVLFSDLPPTQAELNDRTKVVGDSDLTAQNCVIGTSTGFMKWLPQHVGTETGPSDTQLDTDDYEALCPNQVGPDGNGEIIEISDAFGDQSGRGGFSAAVNWAKITPTTQAVQDNAGGLGTTDELCVNSVWSIQDDFGPTTDSAGSLDLDETKDPFYLSDCDLLDDHADGSEEQN